MNKILFIAALLLTPCLAQAQQTGNVKDLPADIAKPAEKPSPLAAEINVPEGPYKTGDKISAVALLKNISGKAVTLDYYAPYVLFPSIRNAETEDPMPVYGPPIDMVSKPKSATLKPGETLRLATDEITLAQSLDPPRAKLPAFNASLAALPKGLYVITYTIAPGKADGQPVTPITATSKSFEVSE